MTDTLSSADLPARRRRIAEGFELLKQGRNDEALRLADALRMEQPHDADVQYLASEAHLANDDPAGALACLEAAMAVSKEDPVLLLKRAENLLMLRRRAEAKLTATRAVQLAPDDGQTLRVAGRVFAACGDYVGARAIYERAVAVGHREPQMIVELALAQQRTGDPDRAGAAIAVLRSVAPQSGRLLYLRSTLQRATPERNHVAELEGLLAAPMPSEADRAEALFALGRELEELGEGQRAFAAIREGAAIVRAQRRRYDPAGEIATVDAICAAYDAAEMSRVLAGHDAEGPIFVVGLPRSGAALVEAILGAHSEVGAAGELLDFGQALAAAVRNTSPAPGQSAVDASLKIDFAALGQDYVRGAREAAPARRLFVDRAPSNYMYCGLIRRALPKARIVHVTRDPMDVGYSIFRTRFGQSYLYSTDQVEVADQVALHERTMRHWNEVVDGIVTVRFEDLVSAPEATARRLVEALGLAWEPGMVAALDAPAAAASAVGRSRQHEQDLAPLRGRLVEQGVLGG